eukprot:gene20930-27780_t
MNSSVLLKVVSINIALDVRVMMEAMAAETRVAQLGNRLSTWKSFTSQKKYRMYLRSTRGQGEGVTEVQQHVPSDHTWTRGGGHRSTTACTFGSHVDKGGGHR